MMKKITQEIKQHCRAARVTPAMLRGGPRLRRETALKIINDYGVSLAETARQVGISTSGVGK